MKLIDGITALATLIIGVAVFTLLLNKDANTVDVIKVSASGFNDILSTLTLQGNRANSVRY